MLGITTIAVTVASAVRTFVVPRAQNAYLTRLVFINVNRLFNLHMKWRKINTYMGRDRMQCWRDYAGWRVNYDEVLLYLANVTQAPYAPWISDRGLQQYTRQLRNRTINEQTID